MDTLNYGATLPFFSDGVFAYKKEWGMSICTRANYGFWTLKINTLSKGTIFFLKENPFITSEKGRIRAVVLLDDEGIKIDPRHLSSKFMLSQLDSPVILVYHGLGMNTEEPEGFHELTRYSIQNMTRSLSNLCQLLLKQDYQVCALEKNNIRVLWTSFCLGVKSYPPPPSLPEFCLNPNRLQICLR